jgi:hypothetical protein
MRVKSYKEGMRQAQENADLTGDDWYLFTDTNDNYHIEGREPTKLASLVLEPRNGNAEWWLIPTWDNHWIVTCRFGTCMLERRDDAIKTALEWYKLREIHFSVDRQPCGVVHYRRRFMRKGE